MADACNVAVVPNSRFRRSRGDGQPLGRDPAIERILKADNLDIDTLTPREVAERMAEVRQGAAPNAFWRTYQAHVRAWTRYADAVDAARRRSPGEPAPPGAEWAVGEARNAINTTFDDVERLARQHGARIPLPRTRI